MAPPVGFKQLMEKIEMVEDQCSDESDKANRNKKKLQDKEQQSTDPFVQKKMAIQEKIAETKSVRDGPALVARAIQPAGCARSPRRRRVVGPALVRVAPSPRRQHSRRARQRVPGKDRRSRLVGA